MDGEAPSIYRESFPTAKKEHVCYECNRPILPGQKYHFAEGCWEGKFSRFKTCESCNDLRHELKYEGDYAPFGQLSDWAYEAGVEFPASC